MVQKWTIKVRINKKEKAENIHKGNIKNLGCEIQRREWESDFLQ